MDKFRSHRQKRLSKKQEEATAKDLGGWTTAGSGAAKFSGGGDVRKQGEMRAECKYTEKPFFLLKLDELTKIQLEAVRGGLESPVLRIDFVNPRSSASEAYAVIPTSSDRRDQVLHTTDRKRVRLEKDALQKHLLEHDRAQIVFQKKKVRDAVYEIIPWHRFLEWLKEETC
jgi:hypothetical protein